MPRTANATLVGGVNKMRQVNEVGTRDPLLIEMGVDNEEAEAGYHPGYPYE